MTATSHPLAAGSATRARNVGLALSALVLAAGLAVFAVAVTGVAERIPASVRVDGIDIGGISPADAQRRLNRHARDVPRYARRPRRRLARGPAHQ
jgi:hypothetical protein